jgi:hypothetical protein
MRIVSTGRTYRHSCRASGDRHRRPGWGGASGMDEGQARSANMSIKPVPSIHILVGLVATAGLVACANPRSDQDHARHRTGQSAGTTAPAMMDRHMEMMRQHCQ